MSAKDIDQQFRSVAETAFDAIVAINTKGKVVYRNSSAERMFGPIKVGEPVTRIMPRKYLEDHKAAFGQAVARRGTNKRIYDVHGLDKNGKEFPIEISLAYYETSEGGFFSAIIRDITERAKFEKQLKEKNEELKRINDLLVGREQKMIELKEQIDRLKKELEEKK